MHTLYTHLALALSTLNTQQDDVLDSAIALFTQLTNTQLYNFDDLLDCLNASYTQDAITCTNATRANTALARGLLHDAVTALDLDSNVALAQNLLAQAILQRSYALQQVYA